MRKLVRTENGFSLIELMVVVGIIGILAAIAVPQFSKFQAKARQTEAKTGLAALYTSERGFFTEYNYYTIDLKNIGFGIEGTRMRYDIGFPGIAACTGYPTGTPGMPAEVAANKLASAVTSIAFAWGAAAPTAAGTGVCDNAIFTGIAFGNPNSAFTAGNNGDVWSMDQAKAMLNPTPGITN